LLVAVGNADVQRHLDGTQVFVGGAAQVGKAAVVQWLKGVSEDQADNSGQRVAE
jgi:hypothetical protein